MVDAGKPWKLCVYKHIYIYIYMYIYIFIHIYANKQLENYDIMRENVVQRAVGVAGNGEEI